MTTSMAPNPGSGGTTTISSLPTELLVRLLSYLPAIDLLSAQRTNRRIHDVVTDSSYLQYIMRLQINGVDDILPPDHPIAERLRLLRKNEKSWNSLQYNIFTEKSFPEIAQRFFILQDGYLTYQKLTPFGRPLIEYGYVDLRSTSPNRRDLRWVHIPMEHVRFPIPLKIEFAVDHNLMVAVSQPSNSATVDVSFFEFTTGANHPLSSMRTVRLPSPVNPAPEVIGLEAEVMGDYVLIAVTYKHIACYVYLISWKTGTKTMLRELFFREITEWRKIPWVVAIDNNVIAIVEDNTNYIEICRLDLTNSDARIKTVCRLELPPLKSNAFVSVSRTEKEWVSTSKHHSTSHIVRTPPTPFRSSKVGSIRFALDYHIHSEGVYTDYPYTMIVSVAELLSNVDTNRYSVPWTDWGPARTRIFPRGRISATPAGPYWINRYSPMMIRDYDFLRARCSPMVTPKTSSLSSHPVFSRSKVEGEQWAGGAVETCLPYREFIFPNLDFNSSRQVIADREWLVNITMRGIAVHNVG